MNKKYLVVIAVVTAVMIGCCFVTLAAVVLFGGVLETDQVVQSVYRETVIASTPTPLPTLLPTSAPDIDAPCSPEKLRKFARAVKDTRFSLSEAFGRWLENMDKRPEYYEPVHQEIVNIYLEMQRLDTPDCPVAKNLRTEILAEAEMTVDITESPFSPALTDEEVFKAQLLATNQAFEKLMARVNGGAGN